LKYAETVHSALSSYRRSADHPGDRGLTRSLTASVLVSLAILAAGPGSAAAASAGNELAGPSPATRERVLDAYGRLPLAFVPNRGQTDAGVRYEARGNGLGLSFTDHGVRLALPGEPLDATAAGLGLPGLGATGFGWLDRLRAARPVSLRLRFADANPHASVSASRRAPGTVSYMRGDDPSRWRQAIPTYAQLSYDALWPGIDMRFSGRDRELKYEFAVAPGADPSRIALTYEGAESLSVGRGGELRIRTPRGTLTDSAPVAYQRVNGRRVAIDSRFALIGATGYRFELGAYDRTRPLVIDPGLAYSTYLGGSGSDEPTDVVIDAAGAAYVTGHTTSTDFPTTAGSFDATYSGVDTFVTKLSPDGAALVYSTYLGGNSYVVAESLAVDTTGAAYVTGATEATDYPITPGAFDTTHGTGQDAAFLTKLEPDGTELAYSSYLSGNNNDAGYGVAVDASGAAYVTGLANSEDFPLTPGAFDTSPSESSEAFLTKVAADGGSLIYSTFLGGDSIEYGNDVAIDEAAAAYVTGVTTSANLPTTAGAYDTSHNGGEDDAFVAKLSPDGNELAYSTYLGGDGREEGRAIAVGLTGAAYVVGSTPSTDFPTTAGAFDTTRNGASDVFVTKLDPSGAGLAYSTYLGGNATETGAGVEVDAAGAAIATGSTVSTDYPTTVGAFDTDPNGSSDAYVTKIDPGGAALEYSTYLGGSGVDNANGLAVDASGAMYIAGATGSSDLPTTPGAFDVSHNGGGFDGFLSKLDPVPDISCDGRAATITGDGTVSGTPGDDVIVTGGGDDTVDGRGGDDVICSSEGDDKVRAGSGNDMVFGGGGADDVGGQAGQDAVSGGEGNDAIQGGDGGDVAHGNDGNDKLNGGSGDDRVIGGAGSDTLAGNAGLADRCAGDHDGDLAAGTDKVTASDGCETIVEVP